MNSDFSDWDSESEASEFRISTKINFKLNVFVQCQQISQKISLEKTSKNICQKISAEKFSDENSRPNKLGRTTYSTKKSEEKVCATKSLKRNHYQKISTKESLKRHSLPKGWKEESLPKIFWKHVCQNLFENNFSAKNSLKRNLCQTNSRNFHQKRIGRNISTANFLKRNLYKTIFKRNPYQEIFEDKIYCTKKYSREISTKNIKINFYPNMSEGKFSDKQDVKGNSLPNKLWIGIPSKQILKETSTKESLIYIYIYLHIKHFLKENLYEQIFEEKSLPRKSFKKCLDQHLSQKILPRKLWRDIPCKKLKRNPYQKVSQETFP